jgi:hypothetical protein
MANESDHAERRAAVRAGRQRGCRVYIPGDQLEVAGYPPSEPPPFYRTWANPRGRIVIQLYRRK